MKYFRESCKLIYLYFVTIFNFNVIFFRESLKVTTAAGCERVANYAFEFCYLSGRKKVTAVHKANIMYFIKY